MTEAEVREEAQEWVKTELLFVGVKKQLTIKINI